MSMSTLSFKVIRLEREEYKGVSSKHILPSARRRLWERGCMVQLPFVTRNLLSEEKLGLLLLPPSRVVGILTTLLSPHTTNYRA